MTSDSSDSSGDDRRYSRTKKKRENGHHKKSSKSRRRHRSRSHSKRRHYSRSPTRTIRKRHISRSPIPSYKKYEQPEEGRCLGVFGLSMHTTEKHVHEIFAKFGPIERTQIIVDSKTGRSRGYCFVYFKNTEDAKVAKDQCTGIEIDDRRIRVDFSLTARPHTPTPGVYMGKASQRCGDRGDSSTSRSNRYEDSSYEKTRNRSPSPYKRRRRSRSRSYSPRVRRYH